MTKGGTYAPPPCRATEMDPAYSDALGVDMTQARGVTRWRRPGRLRLSGPRDGLGRGGRAPVSDGSEIAPSVARRPRIHPQPQLDLVLPENGIEATGTDR